MTRHITIPVPRKIFRAYDIRGNTELLTPELVQQIGRVLGAMYIAAGQKQVVVGFDARLTSENYSHLMAQALSDSGLEVIHIGCVSSPLLYFTASLYSGNGVMITASHNPVSDNGIKWLLKSLPPTPEQIQQVADDIEQQAFTSRQGRIIYQQHIQHYLDYLQHDIQLQSGLKVSVDGLHGSAGAIAKQVLSHLGCQDDALRCEANGHFPFGAPDPSKTERLENLKQSVLQHQSVIGIALDGDGDRVVILDEKGRCISPDCLISLFAKICLQQQTDLQQQVSAEIVCDAKCSTMIAQTTQHYGGKFTMIRTGSSFLRNYLATHGAVFGGEFAGHYVFNDGRGNGYDDGLYAALRVLEYLSQTQQTLTEVLAEFPERIATDDIYIDCHGVCYQHIADCIEQTIKLDTLSLTKVDGIRLDFPFGFGIIRPSNTGEYFTVRFDADNAQNLRYIRQTFVDALQPDFPQIAQAIT